MNTQTANSHSQFSDFARNRRLEIFDIVAASIPNSAERLCPFLNRWMATVDWKSALECEWTSDERLTLEWLQTLLEDTMHVKTHRIFGVFPMEPEMLEAILRAIAVHRYLTYMLQEEFVAKPSA